MLAMHSRSYTLFYHFILIRFWHNDKKNAWLPWDSSFINNNWFLDTDYMDVVEVRPHDCGL
jgi:hypothetical protein